MKQSVVQTNATVANRRRCHHLSRPRTGELDAALSVCRARYDGRTGLRVVPGFQNREKIKTIGGYTELTELSLY